jgi:hypothetical protein
MRGAGRILALLFAAIALVVLAPSCTTGLHPVTCDGGPYRCAPSYSVDVTFCEYEVQATSGADCASMALAPGKRFCVVAPVRCVASDYEVKGKDCRVVQYRAVREWRECSAGAPVFAP